MATEKQWNYFTKAEGELGLLSRKTKKAVKKRLQEHDSDQRMWNDLPDCANCGGTGIHDDDNGITGCGSCLSSGKQGWEPDPDMGW